MARNIVILFFMVIAVGAVSWLLYERSRLKAQCAELRQREILLRKEALEEKAVWSRLYKDCVEEKNALISSLKDLSNSSSSN